MSSASRLPVRRTRLSSRVAYASIAGLCLLAGCAGSPASGYAAAPSSGSPPPPGESAGSSDASAAQPVVAAADRSSDDRALDARRRPSQMLQFIGVGPADRVADLGAGAGYTTELLARAVGPSGVVYSQNAPQALNAFVREAWQERLQAPLNSNVVRMEREYEAPFAAAAKDLDCVTLLFSYHDVVAHNGDRAALNRAVYAALKPGGTYVVGDHSGPAGSGVKDGRELHRIDEGMVRREVEAAGFVFVEGADFLRDENDHSTKPSPDLAFETSRFIHKYKKPE
jgi:predicted methyltransferase